MQKNSYFFAVNSMSKSVYAAVPALASLKTGIFKDGATLTGGAGPIGRVRGGQAPHPLKNDYFFLM